MHLLIAAAGSGTRMGADRNKLLLPLAGRTVLWWTITAALKAETISWIGLVGQPVDKASINSFLNEFDKTIAWIDGGTTRQESVMRGLESLPNEAKHVLIHDGARCLVEPDLFDRCSKLVLKGEAVIAATPVTDTIKNVDIQGNIINTPDRKSLWAAQTPQGFSVADLLEAHEKARPNGWDVTDDASLYERLGWKVKILESNPKNIKVTTPFDLTIAEAEIAKRELL